MWTQDFLVVDKQAYASYTDLASGPEARPLPPYGPGFGCNVEHVRLVDGSYDQLSKEVIDRLAPGYKGEMKVLSTLLLEELYPLLATFSIRPLAFGPALGYMRGGCTWELQTLRKSICGSSIALTGL